MDNQGAYELGQAIGADVIYHIEPEGSYEDCLEAVLESEQNARQYTEGSFIAHEIDVESEYPDEVWASYEEGIIEAFEDWWNSLDGILARGDYRT